MISSFIPEPAHSFNIYRVPTQRLNLVVPSKDLLPEMYLDPQQHKFYGQIWVTHQQALLNYCNKGMRVLTVRSVLWKNIGNFPTFTPLPELLSYPTPNSTVRLYKTANHMT